MRCSLVWCRHGYENGALRQAKVSASWQVPSSGQHCATLARKAGLPALAALKNVVHDAICFLHSALASSFFFPCFFFALAAVGNAAAFSPAAPSVRSDARRVRTRETTLFTRSSSII